MKKALGLVEIRGLSTAVVAADTMAKAANIRILEIENTKGLGYMTIKIAGDVGAVNAAVNAGKQVGTANGKLISWKVIPRPSDYVDQAFCPPDPPVPPSPPMEDAQEETKMETKPETEEAEQTEQEKQPVEAKEPPETKAEPPAEIEQLPETETKPSAETEPPEVELSSESGELEKPKKASKRASNAKGNGASKQKKHNGSQG